MPRGKKINKKYPQKQPTFQDKIYVYIHGTLVPKVKVYKTMRMLCIDNNLPEDKVRGSIKRKGYYVDLGVVVYKQYIIRLEGGQFSR